MRSELHSTGPRVAVIGAGMAGLTCARYVQRHGFQPTLFEKSRGLGGRLATRRADDGIAFDHGAQYITMHSVAFQRFMGEAMEAGAADYWHPSQIEQLPGSRAEQAQDWLVGTPAMNRLVKPLAEGLAVRLSTQITAMERDGIGWRLATEDALHDPRFNFVVCTAPAPQTRALLTSEPSMGEALAEVSIAPCWALMLMFETPFEPGFDVRRSPSQDIAWIARNSSKPQRNGTEDCWVIHASAPWSEQNLELDRDEAAARMIALLPGAFGRDLPSVRYATAHRWRHALATKPLGRPYLCSTDQTLFVGGDWCVGARVEAAFESGRAIAETIIGSAAG